MNPIAVLILTLAAVLLCLAGIVAMPNTRWRSASLLALIVVVSVMTLAWWNYTWTGRWFS